MGDEVAADGIEIRLEDLVRHKSRIKSVCPTLLTKFSEIDVDNSATVSWDELRAYFGGPEAWLEHQFSKVVGLEVLKQQIRQFFRSVTLDERRRQAGHDVKTGGKYHMIFQGTPGTGKTSLARIVAQLLHRIGIIKSDLLVEVQRAKLVAGYVGQTGPKTQKVIEEAKDGVLFIDEAYRLSQADGKNDFGREAIEQLMSAMNEPPGKAPVMVFAGYPDDMDAFMKANSGLYRRIAYTFDFPDYTPQDLAQILNGIVCAAGFFFEATLVADDFARLASVIETNTQVEARELMNGGLSERLFTFAKQALDAREAVVVSKSQAPSLEIREEDVIDACGRIPPPPPLEHKSKSSPRALDTTLDSRAMRAETRALNAELEVKRLHKQILALKASHDADVRQVSPGKTLQVLAAERTRRKYFCHCPKVLSQLRCCLRASTSTSTPVEPLPPRNQEEEP